MYWVLSCSLAGLFLRKYHPYSNLKTTRPYHSRPTVYSMSKVRKPVAVCRTAAIHIHTFAKTICQVAACLLTLFINKQEHVLTQPHLRRVLHSTHSYSQRGKKGVSNLSMAVGWTVLAKAHPRTNWALSGSLQRGIVGQTKQDTILGRRADGKEGFVTRLWRPAASTHSQSTSPLPSSLHSSRHR